ncbi:anti-sigma B factor antagonist/stage II sporulation protein AA (anti-sigma F factor antagonist) [Pullulanibacillus pueri]|uniref:Anti-sigma factor antagonist n=1 Tax=Pullulanibacillus pueri TaxID=1437324 RepID=A0A8J2ZWH1_9BACL|nr:STAS domain-containing protein [Pullulanibacillus pueri]MBM7682786.1 anti-sigma B factor antagonist/stage II sporulation protein AA (anti-sigma F factor antagonist) [Pullulanibacillus pueri]GGH83178.1 hypothetical protein GCM10007096_23660 [Pullulanibacillus pueri]
MLQYSTTQEDSHLTVTFDGDFDIEATELIQDTIKPMLSDYSIVTINLSKVPFVDSSGMGLLIDLVRSMESSATVVRIAEVREEVFEVFELLQLPEILGEGTFV